MTGQPPDSAHDKPASPMRSTAEIRQRLDAGFLRRPPTKPGGAYHATSRSKFEYIHSTPLGLKPFQPLSYLIMVIMTGVTFAFTAVFWQWIQGTQFVFIVAGVTIVAWFGGFLPGVVGALGGLLLVDFFLIEPIHSLLIDSREIPRFAFFFGLCTLISYILEARLRSERALAQSRDQLDVILQGVADAITVQTLEGNALYANDAAVKISDLRTVEEMTTVSVKQLRERLDVFDEQGNLMPSPIFLYEPEFTRGKSLQMNMVVRDKLNPAFEQWLNIKSTPIMDEQGFRFAVNIFRDITERKHQEREKERLTQLLEAQQQRFKNVLMNIPGIIWEGVGQPDGTQRFDFVNDYSEVMLGYSPEDWNNMPDFANRIVHPDDLEATRARLMEIFHSGKPGTAQYRCIRKDGTIIHVESNTTIVLDKEGKPYRAYGIMMDITDRIEAARERERLMQVVEVQQQRLQTVLTHVPGVIWEGTGNLETYGLQHYDFVNDYTEVMLGYTADDWKTIPDFSQRIVHPDDQEAVRVRSEEIFYSGEPGRLYTRVIRKDGASIHVEAHLTNILDGDGKSYRSYGVFMDITDRVNAQTALEQSALNLKRSNEELQQFAYVASHDLQEPLRMVTSYMQLLEGRYKNQLDQDALEFIGYAVDGASRMKALINDLLAYSRVDSKSRDFKRVSLERALERAKGNLRFTIEDAGARVTHDPLPQIPGDETQLAQVFQNMISNALKFRGESPPQIHVGVKRRWREWVVSVRDNGIGIEPPYLERIFVIFQRLHPTGKYPGTGIGLAICKKVVERHGGAIWVESQPGVGTTFFFSLPAQQTADLQPEPAMMAEP